ncbi:MAG: hypothetical protein JNL23_08280 [Chitinophagaceae bacterium]|nr:hypothetical protein [Chitinophagaceae bacterium]
MMKPVVNTVAGLLLFIIFLSMGCKSPTDNTATKGETHFAKNPNGRNDAWSFAGYGGGGAMFHPAVSPFNSNFAFVACDMTGSFVTYNGCESWRMFNLRGPVHFFIFDPLDSNTVYANSIALFKSTDKGNTWNVLYPAPADIKRIISKGDHATEVVVTNDSTERHVLSFAIDPADSKRLYAVISIDKEIALHTSADGGQTWNKEKELKDNIKNIFINPASPGENRTLYLAGTNSIEVKENGTWTTNKGPAGIKKLTELTAGYDRTQNKFIIYAMSGKSYFNPDEDSSGIYYTDNGGATWESRQAGLVNFSMQGATAPEWRNIATSALHPATVYVSYNGLQLNKDTLCIGVAKSEDFGKTWALSWKDRLGKGGYSISENFKSGWLNERFGPTWGENPFAIGVSPANPAVCYATDFGRTVKTTNGGETWEQSYTTKKENGSWMSRGLEVTTGYAVVFDPFDTAHLFIANTDIGLMESNDGAISWKSATQNNGVPREWINSTYWLAFDTAVKGRAWAAMSANHDLPRPKMWRKNGVAGYEGAVLETNNAGKTWKPISNDIGEAAITHVLIDPASDRNKRTLYACAFGKGVYKSVDGGKTWQQKNKGIEGKEPFAWRIVRREKDGALFLIVCRRGEDDSIGTDKDGALYKSINGGESWEKVLLPAETNAPMSLVIDEKSGRTFLSAWGRVMKGRFSEDRGGGIFISDDECKTWKNVLHKDQHVHDITFDPRNKTYYACGFNGSAYRSTDNGETWSRIKGYNFKWGKRVDLDPRNPDKIFIITFGGGVWYGPAAGDDSAKEDIISPVFLR